MTQQLTHELRDAIAANPEHPLRLEDAETKQVYFLVSREQVQSLLVAELQRELEIGYDDLSKGDVSEFDASDIKTRGLARLRKLGT